MNKVELLIIDPQKGFCRPNHPLSVDGAEDDMKRLGKMIERIGKCLSGIHISLDSHQPFHISHNTFWRYSNGKTIDPSTEITKALVKAGEILPHRLELLNYVIDYLTQLEDKKRYPHIAWPEHCIVADSVSGEYDMVPEIAGPVYEWARSKCQTLDLVAKGSNPLVEHYSAIIAEVPHPKDLTTQMNYDLLGDFSDSYITFMGGEAGSHCLANTGRDIANNFGEDNIKKLALLEDATSPVKGFKNLYEDFVNEMVGRGMIVTTTDKAHTLL